MTGCRLSDPTFLGSPPLFRGQPDVEVTRDGRFAFVSTHFAGRGEHADFGVTLLALPPLSNSTARTPPATPTVALELHRLPGANFSPGTTRPANFPIVVALHEAGVALVSTGSALIAVHLDLSGAVPREVRRCVLAVDEYAPLHVDVLGHTAVLVGVEENSIQFVDLSDMIQGYVLVFFFFA